MITVRDEIHKNLIKIKADIAARKEQLLIFETLKKNWKSHAEKAALSLPGLYIENGGEILAMGDLSRGCNACKEGKWDCTFITMECNLSCAFCWRPLNAQQSHYGSVLSPREERFPQIKKQNSISGISISGGEPFIAPERLLQWFADIKKANPLAYCWIYTNGLLVEEKHILRLAELGLDELRFNMAGSGYLNPKALENLASASAHLPVTTVEIPAVPTEAELLMNALATWISLGAKHLNLHELVYEPGTPSEFMKGCRKIGSLGDGHLFAYHPDSRELTLKVMQKVYAEQMPITVNDCSLHSKFRQLRGRRRQLAQIVADPTEIFNDDGELESCVAYDGKTAMFFHPDDLEPMREKHSAMRFAKLHRAVPLHRADPAKWLRWIDLL